jgi:hypothetical protein
MHVPQPNWHTTYRRFALTINSCMVKFAFRGKKVFVSRVEARPSRVAESENVKSSTMTRSKGTGRRSSPGFLQVGELVAVAKSAGLSPRVFQKPDREGGLAEEPLLTRGLLTPAVESYDNRAKCFMREKFLEFRGPVVCFATGLFCWSAAASGSPPSPFGRGPGRGCTAPSPSPQPSPKGRGRRI